VDGELAGVIAYNYPGVNAAGRKQAVRYSPRLDEINRDWAVVSRVIVHPKYRSTGLGVRLLKDTLSQVERKHVELIAVMAEYNPFAEHAGMKLIALTTPNPSITKAIQTLGSLGFDPQRVASAGYNLEKLSKLN
jgi:GNAT superfamily N-acetyltransferase